MSKEILWTKDQKNAIEHNGNSCLVSAAAGSGKTAVLVERIVNKLYTTDIDRYVIVTFTEAAASQMKKGIGDKIKERLANENLSADIKSNLKKQLLLLPDAHISTMHSFCSSLIRTYFDKLDIASDFSIIQPEDRKIVFKKAYEEITEKLFQKKNEAFLSLVSCYCKKTNDDDLFSMTERLFEASCNMPYPKEWLLASLKDLHKDNYISSSWYKWFVSYLKETVNGLIFNYENNRDLILNNPQLEKGDFFEKDLIIGKNVLKDLEENDIPYNKLYNLFNIKFPINSFKKSVSNTLEAEEFKKIREEYKQGFANLFKKFFLYDDETFLRFLEIAHTHAKALVSLTLEIADAFSAEKSKMNVLDYSDLEHYAIKLLTDKDHLPSEIAKEIASQYLEIIIDEYQDTNPIQEVIFNAISKNSQNLFMVGDMKQSIYKFRNADPALFSQKISQYSFEEYNGNRKIFLSQNFRSRNTILDFTNLIFGACMNNGTGEIDYKDEEQLYFGQKSYEKADDAPVEILIIDSDSIDDSLTNTEKEARILGLKIQKMIEDGFKIFDSKLNSYRNAEYKDFAILLRSAKNVTSVFSKQLAHLGIPVFVDDNTAYLLSSYEIRVLMAFLRVIDNTTDDISVASLLKSPVFNISDDDLALISRENKDTFYNKALAYTSENASVNIKLDRFRKMIVKYQNLKTHLTVEELLRSFLLETSFLEYAGNCTGGDQKVTNINFLLKCASDFEADSFKGVYKFLNYIENYDDRTASILSPKKMPDNLNSVTITTIHKSKGLEYPVVILANSGKKFNTAITDNIEFHNNLGFAFNCITENMLFFRSPVKNIIKEKKTIEEISEEMRILYVALTRAKEKLIVSGTVDPDGFFEKLKPASRETEKKLSYYTTSTAKSFMEWIGMALVRTSAFEKLNEEYNILVKENYEQTPFVSADIINFDHFMLQGSSALNTEEINKDCKAQDVSESLSYKYSHLANEIYTKYSVSNIRKNKAVSSNFHRHFERLSAISSGDDLLTPAEKGTLNHFILEKVANKKVKDASSLDTLITSLKEQELLSDVEEKEINRCGILSFINSPLGQKLLSSSQVYTEQAFEIFVDSSLIDENIKGVDILVQGIIDLYFKDNDNYIIIDYKTDKITEKNKEEKISNYKIQLELYKSAVEKMHKTKNVDTYIYFLETNEFVKV